MRGLHNPAGPVVLLLFALIHQSSAWDGKDAPRDQGKSLHLASVTTYDPRELQQLPLDRLSGGLPQVVPYRMAADSQGRILVTDPGLSVVHVLDIRHGRRWQIRGDHRHRLRAPAHITVDARDNLYVTELGCVSVFEPSGRFLRTIGVGVLILPTGISVDKQNRRLYVADWIRNEILSFDLEGKPLQVFGGFGTGPGQFSHPLDIVIHRDTLVVLDGGNSRFELFDLKGKFRGIWPFGPGRTPIAFAFDAARNFYYVDSDSGGLVAMDPEGKVVAGFGQRPFGQWVPRSAARPSFRSVVVDELGNILVLRPNLHVEVIELVPHSTG